MTRIVIYNLCASYKTLCHKVNILIFLVYMYITKHFFFKTIKIFLENYMVMVHDMVRMLAIHTGNKQEVSPESILQKYADQK